MMRTHTLLRTATLLITALWMAPSAFAGDLTPPGPPKEGTMKPLDQVEPRTPVTQADIPLTINTPGSYYLTEDLTANGTAITIYGSDVTLDLAGFTMNGPANGVNYGVYMGHCTNVEIRNGSIRSFHHGIYESTSGLGHRVINVRVLNNAHTGVWLSGINHLVKDCTVTGNGLKGIDAAGMIVGNTVSGNGANAPDGTVYGISASTGTTVADNVVYDNGRGAGARVYGIFANSGCTVTGNTVRYNGWGGTGDSIYGIYNVHGCTVRGNTANRNGYQADSPMVKGIACGIGCVVTGNTAYVNGYGATGTVYGIYLSGSNLVDQNAAVSNGTGAPTAVNMNTNAAGCVFGSNVAP